MLTYEIVQIFSAFIDAIVYISLPFLAVLLVWSGFRFVSAQGKGEGIAEAQKTFGISIAITVGVLGLWALARLVGTTLAGFSSTVLLIALAGFLAYLVWRK